jgi:hypothetical protein
MGKVGVPGLGTATGKLGFPVFDPGDYLVTLHAPKVELSKKGDGTNWNFNFDIDDGPAQKESNASPAGRKLFENIWVMGEEHAKYDPNKPSVGAETIKALVNALGLKLRGEDLEPESFEGLQVGITLVVIQEKDRRDPDGAAVPRNRIRGFFAADGYVSSNVPEKPKRATKGAVKTPAKKRSEK